MDKLKAVNEKNDPDSYGVDVDSGLGVFDAFFASLSMILVSEVSGFVFMVLALPDLSLNFTLVCILKVCIH